MLEEALQDEKHEPNDTAVGVLDFLNALPLGGAAAEARFCKSLFIPLCDRIFGPLLPGQDGALRHKESAWLAATKRWKLPANARDSSQASHSRIASPSNALKVKQSWNEDPVVRLLDADPKAGLSTPSSGPQRDASVHPATPSLLAAIAGESENRPSVGYPFPFLALSKQTQQAWMAAVEWEIMAGQSHMHLQGNPAFQHLPLISDNYKRLFLELLRFKPSEQQELIAYRQKLADENYGNGAAASSPYRQTMPSFASPTRQHVFASPTPMVINNQQTPLQVNKDLVSHVSPSTTPAIRLGMLEYYLVCFLHFAVAPTPSGLTATMASRASPLGSLRPSAPFGQSVFNYLFRQYCRFFLSAGQFSGRDSELFLRVVIALWLESQSLKTTMAVVTSWRERQQRRLGGTIEGATAREPVFDLDASFDLVSLDSSRTSVSTLVTDGLGFLVQHLLSHPQVLSLVQNYSVPTRSAATESPNKVSGSADWCLTEAVTAMQLPLYNYLRVLMRSAPVHTPTSSFYTAMDTWLTWLEPWNLVTTRNPNSRSSATDTGTPRQQPQLLSRMALPRSGHRKPFDKQLWTPYVAANLAVYVVPLAIFLRRARELDFSTNKFHQSCQVVSRVFAVFCPELIDTIKQLLRGESRYAALVDAHVQNLGPYAPPSGKMTLSSCQPDMCILLEEMHMHHSKMLDNMDTIDWFSAKMGGFLGGGAVSGDDKCLHQLVERAKLLVALPDDYEIFAGRGRAPDDAVSSEGNRRKPSRNKEGTLTSEGREQLLRGEAVCSPLDVHSESNSLTTEVLGTYEISWLVSLVIAVSVWLNESLGLQQSRINLRFLGDYRNLTFALLFGYLVWKVTLACLTY